MAEATRRDAARLLALTLDDMFRTVAWTAKPHLAVRAIDGDVPAVVAVDEPVEAALRHLLEAPSAGGVVAGLSALGHATELAMPPATRVRVTLSVTCCDVFAVIRSLDRVALASDVEGDLIAALREWAGLSTCSCSV
jgi:hypothetical protein